MTKTKTSNKVKAMLIAAATVSLFASSAEASARYHHRHHHHRPAIKTDKTNANGNLAERGIVRSKKTGATARVSADYAPKFQAYINDVENHGGEVLFMGGIRRGHCSSRSMHPCGKALDVCQLDRGVVDSRCHLPNRTVMAALALRHNLFEGALWCNDDYGHVQAGISAPACRKNLYAAAIKMKAAIVLAKRSEDEAIDPEAKAYDLTQVATVGASEPQRQHAAKHLHRTRVAARRSTRIYMARRHYRVRYASAYESGSPTYQPQQYYTTTRQHHRRQVVVMMQGGKDMTGNY
jgi:hypothetical protein